MSSRVKTEPKRTPPSQEASKGYTPKNILETHEAIKKFFKDRQGRMDIRTLWSDSAGQWFRVNWWGEVETSDKNKPLFGRKHADGFRKVETIIDSEVVCVDAELVVRLKTVGNKLKEKRRN